MKKVGCAGEQTAPGGNQAAKSKFQYDKTMATANPRQPRQNYLYNPERLPVTYVETHYIEKRKRDGMFLLKRIGYPISISLTEVGRYVDTGWHMTGGRAVKIKIR